MSLNPRLSQWQGKRCWVIGASTGIGRALARHLHGLGAQVALSARSVGTLTEAAQGLNGAEVLPLDMTDAAALAQARDALMDRWGGLDVVLVVAGTYGPMRADAIDLPLARQTIDINLMGVFNAVAAVMPVLKAGAHLGVVSSVAGYRGLPKALAYGASKAAVNNFCEALYLDCQPLGIAVHLICPGFVETPLTAQNDFKMPALISPEQAAIEIVRGFARGEFETHFPKRFTGWLKFARLLPYRWYFPLIRRVTGL